MTRRLPSTRRGQEERCPHDLLFMAMAHSRLGHFADAQECWKESAKFESIVEEWVRQAKRDSPMAAMECGLLRKEVQRVIRNEEPKVHVPRPEGSQAELDQRSKFPTESRNRRLSPRSCSRRAVKNRRTLYPARGGIRRSFNDMHQAEGSHGLT